MIIIRFLIIFTLAMLISSPVQARVLSEEVLAEFEKKSLELINSGEIDDFEEACSIIEHLDLYTKAVRLRLIDIVNNDKRAGKTLKDGRLCVPRYRAATTLANMFNYEYSSRHGSYYPVINDDEALENFKVWFDKELKIYVKREESPEH